MNRNTLVGALMIVALTLAVPTAIAGKGGNGNAGGNGNGNGGGNSGSNASATVSVSPNPAAAEGARVEVTGCGYDTAYPVELHVVHSVGYTESWGVGVWGNGCINPTPIVTSEAGTYTVEVHQRSSRDLSLKASTALTVEP